MGLAAGQEEAEAAAVKLSGESPPHPPLGRGWNALLHFTHTHYLPPPRAPPSRSSYICVQLLRLHA